MRTTSTFAPARRRAAALVLLVAGLLLVGSQAALAQSGDVLATQVVGPITPVMADHLGDAVDEAEDRDSPLLVELDTPGGLETSMRDIVQVFLGADVPIIVHVSPSGGRAASAGAVITFSAHVAAMAPGTNIGAATPIDLGGGEVIDKVVNDSAAYVEAIAQERGRNVEFAVDTVREGRSAPAEEAVDIGAVDLIADSRQDLLAAVDGRRVTLADGDSVTLETADARVDEFELSFARGLLQTLADPNIAYLLLSIGTLGIIYEFASPGAGLGGVVGGIMLLLGFFALSVLPVDLVGVLLLALAVGLFVAEAFVPGIGVFAAGGAISLIFAGLFLFPRASGVAVDLTFLLPVPLVAAGLAVAIGRFVWRAQRRPVYSGTGGTMVGESATVRSVDGATAQVMANGALWRARVPEGGLRVGDQVKVVGLDGLTLEVRPVEDTPATTATEPPVHRP